MSNVGQIKNAELLIRPSQKLLEYIKNIKVLNEDTPEGIHNIVYKNKPKDQSSTKHPKPGYITTEQDKLFIKSLTLRYKTPPVGKDGISQKSTVSQTNAKLLTVQDLHWLHSYIHTYENKGSDVKIYLHELMEGAEIILPKNEEIPRNEELEKRCQRLKAEQQNREYQDMTKNVDGFRKKLPEDTIGYQLKMMNTHLIAVFQFIVSVITGFAFGFLGIELLIGNLDFGFRLMLGLVCALVIAIAELYFLAKKLNQDLEFENNAKKVTQTEQR